MLSVRVAMKQKLVWQMEYYFLEYHFHTEVYQPSQLSHHCHRCPDATEAKGNGVYSPRFTGARDRAVICGYPYPGYRCKGCSTAYGFLLPSAVMNRINALCTWLSQWT